MDARGAAAGIGFRYEASLKIFVSYWFDCSPALRMTLGQARDALTALTTALPAKMSTLSPRPQWGTQAG